MARCRSYPASITLGLRKRGDLRYGENPHQAAAWYADESQVGLGGAELLQGKELSYTNLLDLDAALRIVLEFNEPAAAFIKHTNPCGAAIGSRATDAYVRAREADPLSAFGAVVGLNRPIDVEAARAVVSTKIDALIAPSVDEDARAVLATKSQMRVVIADFDQLERLKTRDVRSVLGAVLVQDGDRVVEAASPWPSNDLRVVTAEAADDAGVDGAALCVAAVRAREVEHRDLHDRQPHAGDRRRADEPRRRGQRGAHEGRGRRAGHR